MIKGGRIPQSFWDDMPDYSHLIGKRFKIEYPNGFVQEKICIDHKEYKRVQAITNSEEYKKQKKLLASEEFFTDKSTFAYAIMNNGHFEAYEEAIIIKTTEII